MLVANMRGGMWTRSVQEEKTDRVHPRGPLFPRQPVIPLSDAVDHARRSLRQTDAIDTDMHARLGNAELVPWLLVLECAP